MKMNDKVLKQQPQSNLSQNLSEESKLNNDTLSVGLHFNSLVNASSYGSHFQFKSEKSWMLNDTEPRFYDPHFHLNIKSLAENVSHLSFWERLNIHNSCCSVPGKTNQTTAEGKNETMFNEDKSLAERLDELEQKVNLLLKNDTTPLRNTDTNQVLPNRVHSRAVNQQKVVDVDDSLKEFCDSTNVDKDSPIESCSSENELENWLDSILDE